MGVRGEERGGGRFPRENCEIGERERARRDFEVATRYPYAWPRPPLDWGLNDAQARSRAGGRRHGAVRIGPEDRKLKLRARSNEACEQQRLGWDDAEPERWRR